MKSVKMAAWGALAGLTLIIPLSGTALADEKGKQMRPVVESHNQQLAAAANTPVYIPPIRGSPGGRVGGSSRGEDCSSGKDFMLSVLVPDHTGLTVHEQPSLYWYLSESTTCPIELTIRDDQAIQPLLESRVSRPVQPGVQRIRLADYNVHLSLDVPYRWYVTVVVDPDRRSKDINAGGFIERIALPEALRTQLAGGGKAQAPFLYAQAGLWYDALTSSSDLIEAAPDDRVLRQQRASLLEQVGLPEIAEQDMRRSRAQ
jgi:Domain of Unknown Function (DUF928)